MLTLLMQEDNTDVYSGQTPPSVTTAPLPQPPVPEASPVPPSPGVVLSTPTPPEPTKPKRKKSFKKTILIVLLVLLFVGSVAGAYFFGKKNEKIVYRRPEPKPLNLPPQAVVVSDCVEGRGKQYILPEDIPKGPIYDVNNGEVVAIEFNLVIDDIEADPDSLSNTILQLTRDYPVDHFKMVPAPPETGQQLESFNLVMFVVTKDEAKQISCKEA